MVEFLGIGIGQRILILGLREPTAHGDILERLHVKLGAHDLRDLRSQPLNHLLGGDVALVERLELNEHTANCFRPRCRRSTRRSR